jgi:DNA-directed RNA polymerase sigma subunit (sigma70/sigma32)
VRRRRHAVNELLTDIYEKRYFLSDILRKGGVSQAEISTIYEERLLTFLDQLLAMWETAFVGKLDPGSWHVLTHSYGLDGLPRASALSLAQELALPEQRVTELRQDALRSLRTPACSGYLEHLAITVARLQFEASAATPGRRE